MTDSEYTTVDGDRIDRICRLKYGTERNGNVELVLSVNRDLADFGPLLPAGVLILLPDIAPPNQVKKTIRLWT